jgi:hypothetical protein
MFGLGLPQVDHHASRRAWLASVGRWCPMLVIRSQPNEPSVGSAGPAAIPDLERRDPLRTMARRDGPHPHDAGVLNLRRGCAAERENDDDDECADHRFALPLCSAIAAFTSRHLIRAALRACLLRCFGVRAAARASPPWRPSFFIQRLETVMPGLGPHKQSDLRSALV